MTLFAELKSTTKAAHDELEKNLDLLSPELSLDDYINVLKKFYGVYRPVEAQIRNSSFGSFFSDRYKLSHLIADLKHFGLTDSEINSLPVHEEFHNNASLAELLGILYVLEGSTLGSLILSKHFASRFDLTTLNGLTFFTAYGANTMPRWMEWKAISERLETEWNLARETVLNSANKTFSELRIWMCS